MESTQSLRIHGRKYGARSLSLRGGLVLVVLWVALAVVGVSNVFATSNLFTSNIFCHVTPPQLGCAIDSAAVLEYDGTTGAFVRTFVQPGSGGLDSPGGLVFGPNGNLFMSSGSTFNSSSSVVNSVLEYNGATGAFVRIFVPTGSGGLNYPSALVFGSNGNLFVGTINSVLEYDGTTGAFVRTFAPLGARANGLAFGPNGNLFVLSYADSVWEYNGTTGAFVRIFVPTGSGGLAQPYALAFGPNGNLFLSTKLQETVLEYNGTTGAFVRTFVQPNSGGLTDPHGMAFGPNGNLFVGSVVSIGATGVLEYDGTTGAFVRTFVQPGTAGQSFPVSLTFRTTVTPPPPQTCSRAISHNVGDTITLTVGLATTDPGKNGLYGGGLILSSSGGEIPATVVTPFFFVSEHIEYIATQAQETITGTISGGGANDTCYIQDSTLEPPLISKAQKAKFSRFATRISILGSQGEAIVLACIDGGIVGLPCAMGLGSMSLVWQIEADLASLIAQDPIDNNFTQLATPVFPSIPPWGGAPGIPKAVVDASNALMANGAQRVGIERALYTTLNRASGAFAAGNKVWLNKQLHAATSFEGQLSVLFSQEASLLATFQHALQAAGITATITPSMVHDFEVGIASTGHLPAADVSGLQQLGADASQISSITQLAMVQDINAVAGTFPQLLTEPGLISLLNSFPVGPPIKEDDCEEGLWKAYNTPRHFKNQGDCKSFVTTGK